MTRPFQADTLTGCGLNLHAVFTIADLPPDSAAALQALAPDLADFTQVLLIGHGKKD